MYKVFEHFPVEAREYALEFDYGPIVDAYGHTFILDDDEYDPIGRCLEYMGMKHHGAPSPAFVSYRLGKDVNAEVEAFVTDWDSGVITDLRGAMGL